MSRSAYLRQWRKNNPANVKRHKRNYYYKHRKVILSKLKEKYQKHCEFRFEKKEVWCARTDDGGFLFNHLKYTPWYMELIEREEYDNQQWMKQNDLKSYKQWQCLWKGNTITYDLEKSFEANLSPKKPLFFGRNIMKNILGLNPKQSEWKPNL
jgi:hypothetical protein